jgi:hypothetical protein
VDAAGPLVVSADSRVVELASTTLGLTCGADVVDDLSLPVVDDASIVVVDAAGTLVVSAESSVVELAITTFGLT